jgi:hypothetical protein
VFGLLKIKLCIFAINHVYTFYFQNIEDGEMGNLRFY